MFTCMCASEDCQVFGCARLREIKSRGPARKEPNTDRDRQLRGLEHEIAIRAAGTKR